MAHDARKPFYVAFATAGKEAKVQVFDNKGALVKVQTTALVRGNNQLSLQMGSLTNGVYTAYVNGSNGELKKLVRVLKR